MMESSFDGRDRDFKKKKKKFETKTQDLKIFLSPRSKLNEFVLDPSFTNKACLTECSAHWAGELVSRVRCSVGPSTMMHILHHDKNLSCTCVAS